MALGAAGDKAGRAAADGPAARGLRPRVYAPPSGPRVLHADAALVVVEKPAGLLTVPGRGEGMEDCLVARVAADFPGARAVHRLDLDTSGVVVLALTAGAHRHLGLQFERRRVEKRYVAVVAGGPELGEAGRIEAPLAVDWPRRPRQRIDPAGRHAVTDWRCLAREPEAPPRGRARLALAPLTGRSHQLRVHLAEAGWPILGDPIYADPDAYAAAPRMLLHAEALALRHPEGGAPIRFEAPAPF